MEQITALVTQYGPLAVLAGTFFEGETIVLVAGFLAHQAVLNPVTVGLCAFAGAVLGDQLWFYLGRRHAGHALVRRLTRQAVFEKALGAIERHPRKFILSYRFIYGLRTVSPVALGLSNVPAGLFLILNVAAAAVWAAAFTALGYSAARRSRPYGATSRPPSTACSWPCWWPARVSWCFRRSAAGAGIRASSCARTRG